MGLDTVDGLSSFCLELSNDKPSPGGGTASAAAGAMAASLLVMVCEITLRSKKHEASWPELMSLRANLVPLRDELISLSLADAKAYDIVVEAIRNRKKAPGQVSEREYQAALKHASEVPERTASACLKTLESAIAVAGIGVGSASSDVGVAVHLAHAGLEGALMNVRINLGAIQDGAFVKAAQEKADMRRNQGADAAGKALAMISGRR